MLHLVLNGAQVSCERNRSVRGGVCVSSNHVDPHFHGPDLYMPIFISRRLNE